MRKLLPCLFVFAACAAPTVPLFSTQETQSLIVDRYIVRACVGNRWVQDMLAMAAYSSDIDASLMNTSEANRALANKRLSGLIPQGEPTRATCRNYELAAVQSAKSQMQLQAQMQADKQARAAQHESFTTGITACRNYRTMTLCHTY